MHEFLGEGRKGAERWGLPRVVQTEENRVCKGPVPQGVADKRGTKNPVVMSTRAYWGQGWGSGNLAR